MKPSNKIKITIIIPIALFLIMYSIFVPANTPAKAATLPTSIAVGILFNSNADKLITIDSGKVTDANGNSLGPNITSTTTISIEPGPLTGTIVGKVNGQTTYVSTDEIRIYPDNNLFSLGTSQYNGYVKAVQAGGYINIVNVVDMDNYVTNVVPYEIGASSPIEALKAQAICARTYAAYNMGKHKSQGFDVCNTTDCQVYGAIPASPNANVAAAVAATSGMMMTYNGAIIDAVFFASTADGSGSGWTEDAKNVWGSDIPYLKSVSSTEAKNSSWTYTISQADATTNLASYGLGTITDIKATSTSAHGAVTALTVTGTLGSKSFTLEKCRTFLSGSVLRSQAYTITKNTTGAATSGGIIAQTSDGTSTISGSVTVASSTGTSTVNLAGAVAQSANGTSTLPTGTTSGGTVSWTFSGRGWGHLVGMSQEGAITMANNGSTYDQILKHYYTGITISK